MASRPVLRVGGVPEHFNYPWHIAQSRGLFDKHGVDVQWTDVKEGTGQLITNAKNGTLDVILALTEGLVADISKGSELRLLGTYVESPLCWAISTGRKSTVNSIEDLKGQKFGISRFTSGSHLMVCVLASQRGWDVTSDLSFQVNGTFENLRNSLNDDTTAAFLWETFMTKPYHDSGEIRRIGDITSPWPCFMFAALKPVIDEKEDAIRRTFAAVREACQIFHAETSTIPEEIAAKYGLKPEDARKWYEGVKITASNKLSEAALERAVSALADVNVLPTKEVQLKSLFDSRFAELEVDIKRMKLYNKPELVVRTYNELRVAGVSRGPLTYRDLIPYDQQHHYHGTSAVDTAINDAHIESTSNIVSLGSGLGGPARYIAGVKEAQVLAVELQQDLHQTAVELTNRCGLGDKVHHVAGDFLQVAQHLRTNSYDAIVSWLTILHITDRKKLFRSSNEILKTGGTIYLEDFYELHPMNDDEKRSLQEDVFCRYLPSLETYKNDIESNGFELVKVDEMTDDWKRYTAERLEKFDSLKDSFVKIHGQDVFDRLRYFYCKVSELFQGGNLGGVRIVAKKK